ncbi:aldehyde dehydrogenase, partial [Aureobasidium melanogenum]
MATSTTTQEVTQALQPSSSSSEYSDTTEVDHKITTLRETFQSGRTKDIRFRKWQLKQLYWLVAENKEQICKAAFADTGRQEFEAYLSDVNPILDEVLYHIEHVEKWAKDTVPDSGVLFTRIGKSYIRHEPLGTVLIIGPWNYPLSLTLHPLASAIAAGCTALLKPSELTPACSQLLYDLLPKYLDPAAYAVVTGGIKETQYTLSHKFDHVFFTGSTPVAKHIAAAAAKHLTPTTLELGGQGPAIVAKSANIDLAAKRIASTKWLNSGQICLNVNHVFVDPSVRKEFVDRLQYWLRSFDSTGATAQQATIINERNYDRLTGMLDKTNGKIIEGGSGQRDQLKLALTVVDGVSMDDSLLTEELFGPILPLVEADLTKAVGIISSRQHPLAIYIFTNDRSEVDYVLDHTQSGGVTVNDTLLHAAVPEAPFGGVGESGSGAYHGRHGFDSFTHRRVVVQMPDWLDRFMGFRYPPYDMIKNKWFVDRKAPPFKREETLEDQRIHGSAWSGYGASGAVLLAGMVAVASQQGYLRVDHIRKLLKI